MAAESCLSAIHLHSDLADTSSTLNSVAGSGARFLNSVLGDDNDGQDDRKTRSSADAVGEGSPLCDGESGYQRKPYHGGP